MFWRFWRPAWNLFWKSVESGAFDVVFGFAFISYIMHWILGIKILENSIEILLWWSTSKWEESKTMDLNVELHLGCGSCRNVVIVSVVVSVFVTVFNKWQIIRICLVWWWLSEAGLSRWKGENAKGASLTFRPLDTRGRGAEALWGWHFESSQNFSSPTLTFLLSKSAARQDLKLPP